MTAPIEESTRFDLPCMIEQPSNLRVVCECHPVPSGTEPALLAALGVLLLAVGLFGYAIGRVRRLRSKLQIRQSQA